MVKPYTEQVNENVRIRRFDGSVDDLELVWHRDYKDRDVKVLQSDGWKFQFDNEKPTTIKEGDHLNIPAGTYHRVIRGTGKLVLEIVEYETN